MVNQAEDRPDWCAIRPKLVHPGGGPTAQLTPDANTTEVWVYDEIGYWGTTASDFVGQLSEISTPTIDLHINSPGGEVFDGLAIYECLRVHPASVTTYVDGLAASIASVIAMAGDKIIMGRSAQMMIHDASGGSWGNARDMRDTADLLDRLSEQIAGVYADRSGKPSKTWRQCMLDETWFFSAEAVTAGLADELSPLRRSDGDPQAPTDRWDLSVFRYSGRTSAPPPVVPTPPPVDAVPSGLQPLSDSELSETIALLREAFTA
jgi:ATP-dependent protease ClpP protease subunit